MQAGKLYRCKLDGTLWRHVCTYSGAHQYPVEMRRWRDAPYDIHISRTGLQLDYEPVEEDDDVQPS